MTVKPDLALAIVSSHELAAAVGVGFAISFKLPAYTSSIGFTSRGTF